jgi:hypothetical protein
MRTQVLLLLLLMWDYSSEQYIVHICDGFDIHLSIPRHSRHHHHHLTLPRNYHNNNYHSISAAGDAYVSSSSSFWRIHLSLKDDEDNSNTNDANGDDNNDNDENQQQQQQQPIFNAEQLSNRIKEVKKSESIMNDQFTSGLQQRVQELQSSKGIEELLFNNGNDNNDNDDNALLLSLPVISFDALLPKQKLEGSTEDTTFIKFLINEIGLGGYFMMTSLEYKSRKIRRNGVLCKIEFLNAAATSASASASASTAITSISNMNNDLPTSVNFVIVGKKRCRVAAIGSDKNNSKNKDLKLRIGRWRRCYDDNCEESQLGWGEERFKDIDVIDDGIDDDTNDDNEIIVDQSSPTILPSSSLPLPTDPKQWNKIEIEYKDLDDDDENDNNSNDKNIASSNIEKVESLIPYVDEWYDLASNIKTYQNLNVTATARIQWDQPYLTIEPHILLRRVIQDLGPRPNATIPTDTDSNSKKVNVEYIFWVAALINPLPALGVSLEIRGNILEATTIKQKLHILELGLIRSIQNLKGERRL